jgi:O-antigen/teichoic acid export membrane protein
LSSIKKLAGQTMWYGLSSIAARFISYLLTPYLTLKLTEVAYGEQAIPFAKLRLEERPKKYAFIKVGGIVINIIATYAFISILPNYANTHSGSFIASWYVPGCEVGYILIANILQNVFVLLLLQKEIRSLRLKIDYKLWNQMMLYALPLILVGFGGMINETMDRIMLGWWANGGSPEANKALVGTYSACYKLAILITISIQAFRMGAEPFFFKQAQSDNAQKTYARVMKFFVITLCIMFLGVVLFLDIWKEFIRNPNMYIGLRVVPILLIANMFLGVYYNLSIWYKLSNKTMAGAWITLLGAVITIVINFLLIPRFGYMASAWATFFCYGTMMVVSYKWGQKVYYVPYATKKLIAYFVIALLLYSINLFILWVSNNKAFNYLFASILLFGFIAFVVRIEKKELKFIFNK